MWIVFFTAIFGRRILILNAVRNTSISDFRPNGSWSIQYSELEDIQDIPLVSLASQRMHRACTALRQACEMAGPI